MESRNPNTSSSSSRTDRKMIERSRRTHMRILFTKLSSLVPHQSSRAVTTIPDKLEEAAKYVKILQIKLERLREKKESLLRIKNLNSTMRSGMVMDPVTMPPKLVIHQAGSVLTINLVVDSKSYNYQSLFKEIIRALHEEEAHVVNASFSIVSGNVFYSIHYEVQDPVLLSAEARISERLHKIIITKYAY